VSAALGGSSLSSIVRLHDGTLVAVQSVGSDIGANYSALHLIRSVDAGRHWARDPEPIMPRLMLFRVSGANLRVAPSGLLEMYGVGKDCHPALNSNCVSSPKTTITRAASSDGGRSWRAVEIVGQFDFAALAGKGVPIASADFSHLLPLRDNKTLLVFGTAHTNATPTILDTGVGRVNHSAVYYDGPDGKPVVGVSWVMKSTNGGDSFDGPFDLDGAAGLDSRYTRPTMFAKGVRAFLFCTPSPWLL
jgi:hypothetical protein